MRVVMDKTKVDRLREVHDLVKKNKFRVNGHQRYLKGYQKLLNRLMYIFGEMQLEAYPAGEENREYRANIFYFGHEFSGNTRYLRHEDENPYDVERFSMTQLRLVMEMNIGLIHRFIDTGEFKEFYTYYAGDICSEGRLCHTVLKNDKWVQAYCDKVSEIKR